MLASNYNTFIAANKSGRMKIKKHSKSKIALSEISANLGGINIAKFGNSFNSFYQLFFDEQFNPNNCD